MYQETVLNTQHYTDSLFSFSTTRPEAFRFRSGEFIMLGLKDEETGKPLLRAYSIASAAWEEELSFFSIKVPNGPLTSRLQNITAGDQIILSKKPTGTLVLDALTPAKTLYLVSTGTGIAPFASLVRDPDLYERFERIVLTHSCRTVAELDYGKALVQDLYSNEFLGELAQQQLIHYTSTTREPSQRNGRITDLIESGQVFADLGLPPLSPENDRVMICGSKAMLNDTKALCEAAGMVEGSLSKPGDFVIERAFVD